MMHPFIRVIGRLLSRSLGVVGYKIVPDMPYVLADWFGHKISIEIMKTVKRNNDLECWVFVVRKSNCKFS